MRCRSAAGTTRPTRWRRSRSRAPSAARSGRCCMRCAPIAANRIGWNRSRPSAASSTSTTARAPTSAPPWPRWTDSGDEGRKLVVILGGDGKGQDFGPLVDPVVRHARAVVLIGRDAPAIRAVLEQGARGVTAARRRHAARGRRDRGAESRAKATRSCCRRPAPASTCSATTCTARKCLPMRCANSPRRSASRAEAVHRLVPPRRATARIRSRRVDDGVRRPRQRAGALRPRARRCPASTGRSSASCSR